MTDVERVIVVNVAVGVLGKSVKYVRLEGVGGFHYEGIKIKPPEPMNSQISSELRTNEGVSYHSAEGYLRMQFLIVSTFSQLSLHSCA